MLHNRSAGAHKQGGLPLVLRVVGAEHEGRVVGVPAATHASTCVRDSDAADIDSAVVAFFGGGSTRDGDGAALLTIKR